MFERSCRSKRSTSLTEIIRKMLCSIYVYHFYASYSLNRLSNASSSSMMKVSDTVVTVVPMIMPGTSQVSL